MSNNGTGEVSYTILAVYMYLNDTDTFSIYIPMLVTMVLIVPDWTCMLLNHSMKYQKHGSLLV